MSCRHWKTLLNRHSFTQHDTAWKKSSNRQGLPKLCRNSCRRASPAPAPWLQFIFLAITHAEEHGRCNKKRITWSVACGEVSSPEVFELEQEDSGTARKTCLKGVTLEEQTILKVNKRWRKTENESWNTVCGRSLSFNFFPSFTPWHARKAVYELPRV